MTSQEKRLIGLLQAKYRKDPIGFRKYLPGAAELLPEPSPSRAMRRSAFGLTEQEVAFHRAGLGEGLSKLEEASITAAEAAKALQHCAALMEDDNLPDQAGHEALKGLVSARIGKSPGSYKSKTTVPLGKDGGEVHEQISIVRGVYLDLDRDKRLVSISLNPRKVRDRRRLMEFVGAGRDAEVDVAAKHDDYLAMQDPHGTA